MNQQMKVIFDKIKEYDRIVIFRHKRPDGDAVGSTLGLRGILRLSFPNKEIVVNNSDYSDYVGFLGDEDAPCSDEFYAEALGIVIDTATEDRVSNPRYNLCKEICKIDHHIPKETYGNYQWVEEHRSSACEMIAAFYAAFKDELKIDVESATLIYAGMDTDHLYAHLYMKDFNSLKLQAYVYDRMKMSEHGVAYIYINRAIRKRFKLTFEQACACVGYMDSIKDSLIWIAFIESDDGSIRVRLRSRFVTINEVAEKYNGGGHDCASGATVHSRKEMKALIADADARLADYKENNEGWL